jgi:hypothetical protein
MDTRNKILNSAQRLIQAYTAPEEAETTLEVQGEDWLSLGTGYTRCGDLVRADYFVSFAAELRKPTPEEAKNPFVQLDTTAKAPPGTSPAGATSRPMQPMRKESATVSLPG